MVCYREIACKAVRKRRVSREVEMLKQRHKQIGRTIWAILEYATALIVVCFCENSEVAFKGVTIHECLGNFAVLDKYPGKIVR